tara:strand:+ start:82 stop:858 length:777 start_codon:yes stop_codon:yes gene_type:complete
MNSISNIVKGLGDSWRKNPKTVLISVLCTGSFVLGVSLTHIFENYKQSRQKRSDRENAGACREYNSSSFYYGDSAKQLQTIPDGIRRLPDEFYGKLVQSCVIACCDCLIVRVNKLTDERECLLVERKDEPAKGLWWFPGGRILKGETFFQAALRKTTEETGLSDAAAIQILGVYQTFFSKSHWEDKKEGGVNCGTQTMNTVVLVEVSDSAEVTVDESINRFRWTRIENPDTNKSNGDDPYIVAVLRRLQSWDSTFVKK